MSSNAPSQPRQVANTPLPTAMTDRFGVRVPSAMPPLDDREITIMRLLGRLDLLTAEQVRHSLLRGMSAQGVKNTLDRLVHDDLAWRLPSRTVAANQVGQYEKVRRQSAFVYGLTDSGKELLSALEVETDPLTIGRLVSRDPRGRKPDIRTMSHDLQVSWWCLNVIMSATYNRSVRSMYVQAEFVPEQSQRIDALVILRLSPEHPRAVADIGPIPFFDGTPRRAGEIDVRLALEVDKGTEPLSVLLGKGVRYRDLHRAGIYTSTVGGPVLAVFLAQSARRAAQIATEFRAVWPTGWGVVSTPASANNVYDGVLWGAYKALTDGKPFDLLTHLVTDASGHIHTLPALSQDAWRKGEIIPPIVLSPEQEAARKGGLARVGRTNQHP